MTLGKRFGMVTMEESLAALVQADVISDAEAAVPTEAGSACPERLRLLQLNLVDAPAVRLSDQSEDVLPVGDDIPQVVR